MLVATGQVQLGFSMSIVGGESRGTLQREVEGQEEREGGDRLVGMEKEGGDGEEGEKEVDRKEEQVGREEEGVLAQQSGNGESDLIGRRRGGGEWGKEGKGEECMDSLAEEVLLILKGATLLSGEGRQNLGGGDVCSTISAALYIYMYKCMYICIYVYTSKYP